MNRSIWATVVYIFNDFKCVHNKTYSDFFASTRENFRAADLMIRDINLIKKFWANVFFDDDFVESFSVIVNRIDIIEIDTSISSTRAVVFKFSILKIASVISRKTSYVEKINQLNKSSVVSSAINSGSFQIRFFNLDKKVFVFSINQDSWFTEHKFSFIINENVLNKIFWKDIAKQILKRILLLSTANLYEIVRFEANKQFLNAFNNAVAFIFNIDDYIVSICICIEVLNILRYKINNIRSTLNELMLIITELRNVHEENENKVCLKH